MNHSRVFFKLIKVFCGCVLFTKLKKKHFFDEKYTVNECFSRIKRCFTSEKLLLDLHNQLIKHRFTE